jgi:3-methylcrotonyl-CoA carboxylase alpha subunit
LDLVEWQLRVASGEPLPLRQDQLQINGHAIEARICAENPDNQFLPATGTLAVYRKPTHVAFLPPLPQAGEGRGEGHVRFDDGVREGDAISPYYDSMVAKLIVHGRSRDEALARLDTALAQTHIVGLTTNVQFLRHVVQSPSFAQARLDTALIQREAAVLFDQDRVGQATAVAAAVAQTLMAERQLETCDPFSRRDGWRPFGLTQRRFDFDYRGQTLSATLTYAHDGALHLAVGDTSGVLAFAPAADGAFELHWQGQRLRVHTHTLGEQVAVFTPLGATTLTALDALAHAGEVAAEGGRLTAPMPGKVVSFAVKAGDAVKKGQPLAVMEAMKMEHTIAAPADGTVAELLYAPGDQVGEGAELLKLATA